MIKPSLQSLVTVACIDEHVSMFTPIHPTIRTMASATSVFPGDDAETGTVEVFKGHEVCQQLSFQAHDFSLPHITSST